MRYYRSAWGASGPQLLAVDGDTAYDLTAAKPSLDGFTDLARASDLTGTPVDDIARRLRDEAPIVDRELIDDGAPAAEPTEAAAADGNALVPVEAAEVWAAGVTYAISEQAREEESDMPQLYLDVYDAERPELFFKSTARRTVGPGEPIGIRGDSDWNVPEPELAVVLHRGEIVGYTIGNDVSSRDIEGENPLYLPQAKVYDRSCAIGPCVASTERIEDPHDLDLSMTIRRGGETVYDESTSTSELVRTCEELVSHLQTHNTLPETTVLLTGTSLVPDDEFTLQEGDVVSISIEGIGTLENPVCTV
ncbi:fumarylacetoacetate hydrolase family protein [Halovivax cerinus]|uniref:Fumarylacetoacetate hydrolase family protein n=1 Tax=Halovivax cerinus TaxID=1487865 RepID=A0ABD5NR12_9EURY|nr:fumarylacetoacetate hydrolase family protein [Halovivax cerinus]